jgi:hypothetical protein
MLVNKAGDDASSSTPVSSICITNKMLYTAVKA